MIVQNTNNKVKEFEQVMGQYRTNVSSYTLCISRAVVSNVFTNGGYTSNVQPAAQHTTGYQ